MLNDIRVFCKSVNPALALSAGKRIATADEAAKADLRKQDAEIRAAYDRLSESYQSGKADNNIPLN